MIVLKILLWILLAVLGLIVVVLMLPVSARVSFIGGKLTFMVKYAGLPVLGSGGRGILSKLKKKKKKKKPEKKKPSNEEKEKEKPKESEEAADNAENPENTGNAAEKADDVKAERAETSVNAENEEEEDISEVLDGIDDEVKKEKKKRRRKKDDTDYDAALDDLYKDDEKGEKSKKGKKKEPKTIEEKIEFILDIWGAANRPLLKIFKGFKFSELYIDFIIANEDAYKCALNYGRICAVVYNMLGVMGALCNVKFKTVDINPGFSIKKGRYDFGVKFVFCPIVVVIAGLWFLMTYIFRVLIPNKTRQKSAARQK